MATHVGPRAAGISAWPGAQSSGSEPGSALPPWGAFWVVTREEEGVLLASGESGPGMLIAILRCSGQPLRQGIIGPNMSGLLLVRSCG